MKKKTITLVVYMLVCISLVSVGFAAWIITGGTSETTQAGITASEVTDQSINITGQKWTQSGAETATPEIIFGAPVTPSTNTNYIWLKADGVATEKLEATYSFTIKVGDDQNTTTTIKEVFNASASSIEFSIDADHQAAYTTATTDNAYITAPVITYTVGGDNYDTESAALAAIAAVETNSVDVSIKIEFDWGTKTLGDNPHVYFNGESIVNADKPNPSAADKTNAKDVLSKVYALNGAKYNLAINFDAK